ncbi:MAG TPA: aminotransferase class III-fold pyridoxal phosphate-dependent enzyme [Gemmataceae bacterium]|nr:aminotransferase class III-fold pyridoxal phosphate-dependent enzyme [Gemmataceae bacterium]
MRSNLTAASTACEASPSAHPLLADTCALMIRGKIPNFFRLYLNPYVVQACYCLSKYVLDTWQQPASTQPLYQSFLANSFDEALSGAIKLARYCSNLERRSTAGLLVDPSGRLRNFALVSLDGQGTIQFIPGLHDALGDSLDPDAVVHSGRRFGLVVLVASPELFRYGKLDALRTLIHEHSPLVITCVDRQSLTACQQESAGLASELPPDIVVFDESFVHHEVPFAAFTAKKSLYDHWNKIGQGAFHSTTFQPNTISSLHFMRCLEEADPEFHAMHKSMLEKILRESVCCTSLLGSLYSPFLAKTIATLALDNVQAEASGHYVTVEKRKIFDGVAGIACSIRGHNPETYVPEIEGLGNIGQCHEALADRLRELTGLPHMLPAVSGASAAENALKAALVAQHPRRFVLAFQGGFGGKTLLALAGTAKAFYKSHLEPLYEDVLYIDPFCSNVLEELETTLEKYQVAVVQIELIQAVGGVRPIPAHVLKYLADNRQRFGYLLFVDEVQTGMYRTGPFILSQELGLTPDILTLGKGVSDMMFPFSLTLLSGEVQERLDKRLPEWTTDVRNKFGYEWGYKTVLNTLVRAREWRLPEKVVEAGQLFSKLLSERLADSKVVRDIRVHGLLIAIELDTTGWPRRWFKKRLSSFYLLSMLNHRPFPLLIGYCQYEPHVLKLTPPLSITPDEIRQVCETIETVLNRPFYKVLATALSTLARRAANRLRKRESLSE